MSIRPIRVKWAAPGTCWRLNDWKPGRVGNYRYDFMFSVHRVYIRELRAYFHVLTIGRMKITFGY